MKKSGTKHEIVFNSVVFGFMVDGEPVGVEFHAEGEGIVSGKIYPMVYDVRIKYKGCGYSFRTSFYANKSNAKNFLLTVLKEHHEQITKG